jgi:hypothetical protein
MFLQDPTTQDGSAQAAVHLMAVVISWFGGVIAVGALLLMVTALAPNITHRAGYCLRTRGLLSFLVGLGSTGVLLVGGAVGQHVPALAVIVLALSAVALIVALVASSEALGRKLAMLAGRDGSRVSHLIWGWFTFVLAGGIPFVGWFVILPYGIIAGMGAAILGFFVREEL